MFRTYIMVYIFQGIIIVNKDNDCSFLSLISWPIFIPLSAKYQ